VPWTDCDIASAEPNQYRRRLRANEWSDGPPLNSKSSRNSISIYKACKNAFATRPSMDLNTSHGYVEETWRTPGWRVRASTDSKHPVLWVDLALSECFRLSKEELVLATASGRADTNLLSDNPSLSRRDKSSGELGSMMLLRLMTGNHLETLTAKIARPREEGGGYRPGGGGGGQRRNRS
jgi:hypothetical protein